MGLFRMLKEWREQSDGTLTGPALRTEKLSNAGETTELLHDLPDNPPSGSVQFDVDTGTYNAIIVVINVEQGGGSDGVELTMGSASDGDYSYVQRGGTTFTSTSTTNDWIIGNPTNNLTWTGRLQFENEGVVCANGHGEDDHPSFRGHLIEGIIASTPSFTESFTVSQTDGNIEQVKVVGVK